MRFFILLVSLSCFLSGCLPDSKPVRKENIKLVEGNLGTENLFVPQKYFRLSPNFLSGTLSLQMTQPVFIPLSKTPTQMWKDGEQLSYLRVLVHMIRSTGSFAQEIKAAADRLDATEVVGMEYGLIHLKQPHGKVQDNWDVWLENDGDKSISYITCSEKLAAVSVPQCAHAFKAEGLYITIDYDKRNLPQWKTIQTGVVDTIRSFKSPDTARDVLFQKLTHAQSQTRGDK